MFLISKSKFTTHFLEACATILDLYTTDGMQKYSLTKEALQSMRKQVEASQNVNENRMVVDSLKSSLALTKGNIREHNYSEESKNHTQNDLRNDNASVRGIAHLERHFSKTEDIAPSAQSTPSVLPPPSPANSVLAGDTPLYMPPPPDTPFEERASSSTPTFDFPTPAYNDLKSASRDDWDDRLMAKKQRII